MANFRVETALDIPSGLYYAEVFFPNDAIAPFVRTRPRFPSHEVAMQVVMDMFKSHFPDHPVTPSGGGPKP